MKELVTKGLTDILSSGSFLPFNEIDFFMLVILALTENFIERSFGSDWDCTKVRYNRSALRFATKYEIIQSFNAMMKYMRDIDEYSLQNFEEVINIYDPENRSASSAAQNEINRNIPLFINSPKGHFVRAVLVNAIDSVDCAREAEKWFDWVRFIRKRWHKVPTG